MGKQSGGTRKKGPNKASQMIDYLTDAEYNSIIDDIVNKNTPNDAWNKMSQDQRELALMEAGFSGAISDDFDLGNIYYEVSKDSIVDFVRDDIQNRSIDDGIYFDDSISVHILYKDGKRKYIDESTNDFDDIHITDNMSYKGQKTAAQNGLKISKVAAIIRYDGYDQPRYYVAKGYESMLKEYAGFEYWKNGRGEKKRDYIQDDWV
jgi:hypothetical protein